jgi:hypothetical protein
VREKAEEMKQLGGLIATVPDLAGMVPAGAVQISSPNVQVYHDKSPETDARFLMVTHKPSNGQTDDSFTITADLPDGHYTFPAAAPMRLNGFDAKWLVAGVTLGGQRLVYSTSELQAALKQDGQDLILLYGRAGESGETMLRYASAPKVTVLEGATTSSFDAAKGDLRLNYDHKARSVVRIEGGGRPALTLILADEAEAVRYWKPQGSDVLVRGPALVRTAVAARGALTLTGDTKETTPLELWAPAAVKSVRWNGAAVALKTSAIGSRIAAKPLDGPAPVTLPMLANWKMAAGTPEADPAFDDAKWQAIGPARQRDDHRQARWPAHAQHGPLRLP